MKKVQLCLAMAALALVLCVGFWAWCAFGGAPTWLATPVQGATESIASSMGLHIFAKPSEGDEKQTVANLPVGYYVYIGEGAFHGDPKWVAVNPGGTINWLNKADADANKEMQKGAAVVPASNVQPAQPPTAPVLQKGDMENMELAEYPHIKWVAKRLDANDAVAQLETTYEQPSPPGPRGLVKYKLTLLKAPSNSERVIQLLDKSGFKILEFSAKDFRPVPGSDISECRDSFPCNEEDYRQVRDYAIN